MINYVYYVYALASTEWFNWGKCLYYMYVSSQPIVSGSIASDRCSNCYDTNGSEEVLRVAWPGEWWVCHPVKSLDTT